MMFTHEQVVDYIREISTSSDDPNTLAMSSALLAVLKAASQYEKSENVREQAAGNFIKAIIRSRIDDAMTNETTITTVKDAK